MTVSTRVLWLRSRIPFGVVPLVVTPLVVTPLVVEPLVVTPLVVAADAWLVELSLTLASLRTERVRRLLLSGPLLFEISVWTGSLLLVLLVLLAAVFLRLLSDFNRRRLVVCFLAVGPPVSLLLSSLLGFPLALHSVYP